MNLVERLASDGTITPSEADALRVVARKRNRIAHGDLQSHADPADLTIVLQVSQSITAVLKAQSDDLKARLEEGMERLQGSG